MMVEPAVPYGRTTRATEETLDDVSKSDGGGDIFQSFDGMMEDLFDLPPEPTPEETSAVANLVSHTTETTEGEMDPTSSMDAIDLDLWRYHNPSNAVHMHVQENAKLPSLNFSVDR